MLTTTLLALNLIAGGLTPSDTTPVNHEGDRHSVRLFDFESDGKDWRIIDDGVMGGVSKGTWRIEQGSGIFEGTLSLENNGGFSSVRSAAIPTQPSDAATIRIRVKGDGRRYQFRVRTSNDWDGPAYQHEFDTKPETWLVIDLPLAAFQASFRGRILPNMPPLRSQDFATMGFLLADKKPGPFRLDVDWIDLRVVPGEEARPSGD